MSLKKDAKYKINFQCPECGTILENTLMGAPFCKECNREWSEGEIRDRYST